MTPLRLVAIVAALLCLIGCHSATPEATLSWQDMHPDPEIEAISDGHFFDDQVGLVTGKQTWRTIDGGVTWRKVTEQGFTVMEFADDEVGYACAGGWNAPPGLIFKTEDSGLTWREVYRGSIGLHSLAVGDREHIIAGNPWRPDSIWVSADGGANWTERHGAGGNTRGALIAVGSTEFYALNHPGALAKSTDGGLTWETIATIDKTRNSAQLLPLPGGTLLLSGGSEEGILKSMDGGKSFALLPGSPVASMLGLGANGSILAASPGNLEVVNGHQSGVSLGGEKAGVWESTDGGKTWALTLQTTLRISNFHHVGDTSWAFGGVPGKVGFWPVPLIMRKGPPLAQATSADIVPIHYTLPKDGYITLTIEDLDGVRVRNLLANQPRPKGANTDYWDGRNQWGEVMPPGPYRWRGLTHTGLHVSYEFSYNTPGQPPWENGEGTGDWGSDHRNPQAIADAGSRVILGWPMHEGGSRVNAVDVLTGRKLWKQRRRLIQGNHYGGSSIALAADAQYAYAALQTLEGGIGFCRLDLETGQEVDFQRTEDGKRIRETDHICTPAPAPQGEIPSWIEQAANKSWNAATAQGSLRGCAVDDRHIYISSYWDNRIYICDKETAADLGSISVPQPAGLAISPQGHLFAIINHNAVVRLTWQNTDFAAATATEIVTGLEAPMGLTTDSQGQLYVSQRGSAMNVSVFDAHGKRLRTLGKAGGRPFTGAFDPAGMLMPYGIAVDDQQRLWVAEEDFAPRRISLWQAETGALITDYIGRSTYGATGGAVNPDDPTMALDTGTIFQLDWETGSSRPVYSLPRLGVEPGAVFGWPYPGDTRKPHGKARFLQHEGRQYLLLEEGPMQVLELVEGRWLRRAVLGTIQNAIHGAWRGSHQLDVSAMPGYDPKTWKPDVWPPAKGMPNYHFIWCDQNGDGLIQPAEVATQVSAEGYWGGSHGRFGDDLTAQLGTHAIAPSGLTACGAPLYQFKDLKRTVTLPDAHPNGWNTWLKTPKGWLIASGYSRDAWKQTPTPDISGLMGGYNPQGKRTWFFPSYFQTHGSFGAPLPKRGLFVGDWYYGGVVDLGGELGEVFHVAGNLGQHYLFTADGLYISELFRDARSGPTTPATAYRGMSLDSMTNGTEGWLGGFFRHPDTGRLYVLSCPNHAGAPVISEVTGLDSAHRLSGMLRLTAAGYRRAQENPALGTQGKLPPGVIAQTTQPPTIDGDLSEWSFARSFDIPVDAQRGARVAMHFDTDHLYLAYQVRDPYPLQNAGGDLQLLFKTGSAVDLMLATDQEAAAVRRDPVAGDLRLLLSIVNDRPVCMLYRPVAPGATDPSSFSSPNVSVPFDSVHQLSNATIAYTRSKAAYTLEAAVSLADLGWQPKAGTTVRGDVGIIYANDTGTANILRKYWANSRTNLTADVGEEARLTPAEWADIRLEPPPASGH